jgi:hypothetical protein
MLIRWEHDGEERDPFAVLGSVLLEDDAGGRIEDDILYLDTWLSALAQGLLEVRGGAPQAVVDTVDEPHPIRISNDRGIVTIRWREQGVRFPDLEATCVCLAEQLRSLVDDLLTWPAPHDVSAIQQLRQRADRLMEGLGA